MEARGQAMARHVCPSDTEKTRETQGMDLRAVESMAVQMVLALDLSLISYVTKTSYVISLGIYFFISDKEFI